MIPAAETYVQLLTNPAHIGAEITWDLILDLVALPFAWLWKRHHDRVVHGHQSKKSNQKGESNNERSYESV